MRPAGLHPDGRGSKARPCMPRFRRISPDPLGRSPASSSFVVLVALMMGVTAFAVDAVLPGFPAIAASFAVADPNRLQLVVYVYMLGFGVAQLVYGPASDVVGRRPAYLVGAAIFLVGCAMAVFADSLTSLLVARFVQGIGAASGRVLATAIVRDRFAGRDMARVMSLNMTVFIMVPIFAPAIGSGLLLLGEWHGMFIAMLVTGLALGLWFWLRMPETLADQNRMPFSASRILDGFRVTLTTRSTAGYATAVGLMFGCVMSMVGSAQQIFTETYGLGALFPLAFGLLATSMGLAAIVNARIVRRFGMRPSRMPACWPSWASAWCRSRPRSSRRVTRRSGCSVASWRCRSSCSVLRSRISTRSPWSRSAASPERPRP